MKAARRSADPFPKRIPLKLTRMVTEPPTGPAWVHEIKHDGYRMLAYRNGGGVLLETRNKHNWTARFPRLVQELQALKARQVVLDCELSALLPDGVTSFHHCKAPWRPIGPTRWCCSRSTCSFLTARTCACCR